MTAADPTLEDAILVNRDDPEPYLVYADWLAQRGDPRAELIMLQHRAECIEPENGALLEYRDEFLRRNPALVPQLDRWRTRLRWHWGFIDRVELDDPTPDELVLLLEHPSCRLLRHLLVDCAYADGPELVATLGDAVRPTLASLVFVQAASEDGPEDLVLDDRLWERLPRLTQLEIGERRLFATLRHPVLQSADVTRAPRPGAPCWNLPALASLRWDVDDGMLVDDPPPTALHELWNANVPALRDLSIAGLRHDATGRSLLEDPGFARLVAQLDRVELEGVAIARKTKGVVRQLRAHARMLRHLREVALSWYERDYILAALCEVLPNLTVA